MEMQDIQSVMTDALLHPNAVACAGDLLERLAETDCPAPIIARTPAGGVEMRWLGVRPANVIITPDGGYVVRLGTGNLLTAPPGAAFEIQPLITWLADERES